MLGGFFFLILVYNIKIPSMGQIELFNYLLDLEPFMLNRITNVR